MFKIDIVFLKNLNLLFVTGGSISWHRLLCHSLHLPILCSSLFLKPPNVLEKSAIKN